MPRPYKVNDKFAKKAKRKGYRARSVFKLMELDAKFELLYPGEKVLDVGAAPGSWLQYTSEKIAPRGLTVGLDLQPILPVGENVVTAICDISDLEMVENILKENGVEKVDLILSDIAPNTTGITHVDQKRSIELNWAILEIAKKHLKKGGKMVLKVFRGVDFPNFIAELKKYFEEVRVTTVHVSRDRSKEIYVICE